MKEEAKLQAEIGGKKVNGFWYWATQIDADHRNSEYDVHDLANALWGLMNTRD